ncbi:MAG TPA: deoxyribonuclease IV [Terriglobales bacterium]|nr:deoxyribonuclease IV [Terriglobales bacterium]
MVRALADDQDVRTLGLPKGRATVSPRRIGIHTSVAGGVENAAERAWRLGCGTFQIFSSNPRQWKAAEIASERAEAMLRLRSRYRLSPLAIHANYLINLAGAAPELQRCSVAAFRSELQRALALGAEFLIVHPGSFRGGSRAQGVARVLESVARAAERLDLAGRLTVLIENTAGAGCSLGASFEEVAELADRLRRVVPAGACIDTCHTHVAGYDIVSEDGYAVTLAELQATVGLHNVSVWHVNDAKAPRGSRLDRHQHIGRGMIGREVFRRLLHDPRLAHAAFIAETPIDKPGDDRRNVTVLRRLAGEGKA